GVTSIVSRLIVDWNPFGSAVVQVTVSLVALIRQSAKAAVGVRTPKPARAVPNMRNCFVEKRSVILIIPLFSRSFLAARAALPFPWLKQRKLASQVARLPHTATSIFR